MGGKDQFQMELLLNQRKLNKNNLIYNSKFMIKVYQFSPNIYVLLIIFLLFVFGSIASASVNASSNVNNASSSITFANKNSTMNIQLEKVEIMPIKDVKVGMKGYGKTVIRGSEIATFDVEVMGILSNNKLNENILISGQSILVRVSGKVIDEAGGIAAGMSGSPIYLNNKIVGGLSSGWIMTDHTVGLVTPIEEMLEILNYPTSGIKKQGKLYDNYHRRYTDPVFSPILWKLHEPIKLCNKQIERIWEVSDVLDLERNQVNLGEKDAIFLRASTPVFVQGISRKYLDKLSKRLKRFNLKPTPLPNNYEDLVKVDVSNQIRMQANTSVNSVSLKDNLVTSSSSNTIGKKSSISSSVETYDNFVPGSALGVQLARGDINLTTIGTLTYKDGKRILAFAHPFLKKGEVSYILTKTHIYHCFSSVQMPFKIGAPTEMIGIITQDREKGIAGELGRYPPLVPIRIEVTDKDLNKTKTINYQIVQDESVFLSVLESTLSQAIVEVSDREGGGTALIRLNLECSENGKGQIQVRKENIFYSKDNIIETVVSEIVNLLNMLQENEISHVKPTRLDLKVEIESERKTITIEKVEVLNKSVIPGGMLDLAISLRPYRLKPQIRKTKVNLPPNLEKENLIVVVYGNNTKLDESDSSIGLSKNQKNTKDEKSLENSQTFNSVTELVNNWINSPKNSDIIIKVYPESEELRKVENKESNNVIVEIIPTSLVVLGRVETTINLSEY